MVLLFNERTGGQTQELFFVKTAILVIFNILHAGRWNIKIFSCAAIIAAIGGLKDGSLDGGSGALVIGLGVVGIILGWIINERNKNKKS